MLLAHANTHTQDQASDYGIDWSGPSSSEEAENRVVVPEVPSYLEPCQLSYLKSLVNPCEPCDDWGKGFYLAVRLLVREIIGCQ